MTHQVHKYILIGTHNSGKKKPAAHEKRKFKKKKKTQVLVKANKFSPY